MEQTHNTDDLHDLVTLDPTIRDYVNLPTSAAPSSSSNGASEQSTHSRRRSPQIFPSFSPPTFDHESSLNHTSAMTTRRSSRWPFINRSSRGSGSLSRHSDDVSSLLPAPLNSIRLEPEEQEYGRTQSDDGSQPGSPPAVVVHATKDSDDVDDTYEVGRRRGTTRQHTATATRVNRLFTMQSPTTSRAPSFQKQSADPADLSYMRSQPGETASLPHHLLDRGLMQGKHSDIVVKVFDRKYNLHRIILDRAPFFASALSPPWCEASQKEVELHPEDIDTNITQRAFELALKRLYGCSLRAEEDEEAVCLFATGCWLEMQDLICDSMTAIMRRLGPPNLAPVIQVVSANYYGKPGDKILESAKAMLCRNGADMAISTWDGVPIDLVRELVGSDAFFVKDEWSRWRLAKRLLDRRLKAVAREAGLWTSHSCQAPIEIRDRAIRPKPAIVEEALARIAKDDLTAGRQWEGLYSHSDVRPLLELLDEDVYYVHMDFEQLQAARNARDVFGVPVLLESTIQDALWSNLELRQKVLNSAESGLSIGLQQYDATDMAEDSVAPTSSRVASKRPFNSSSERNTPLALQSSSVGSNRHYSIPSTDCNIVLGGSDERAHTTRTIDSPRNPHTTSHLVTTSDDTEHTEASSLDIDTTSSSNETTPKVTPPTYSTYPPYRFAVELPSARVLKDRRKFFSHTVFYAGSHWNVYIKKVKNGAKNPHLGVYLHRAPRQQKSTPATSPSQGAVDRRIGALEQRMHHRGNRIYHRPPYPAAHIFNQDNPAATWTFNMPQYNTTAAARIQQQAQQSPIPNIDTYSSAAVMTGPGPHMPTPSSPADPYMAPYNATSFSSSSDDENTSPTHPPADLESLTYQPSHPQVPTLGAYVDKRPTIKTYFKIFSPSRGGRVLSVYESVPCDFNFSQSWGWKSSSLMADDENDDDEIEEILPVGETSFVADGDGVGAAEEGKGGDRLGKESSRRHGFRFCVVLGVV